MNFLNKLIDKDSATSIAEDGMVSDVTGFIDTGSYALNALLSGKLRDGGIPNNKITILAGDPATGKTFYLLGILKNYFDLNPSNVGFLFETEYAITKKILEERGVDPSRLAVDHPDTIEQLQTLAFNVVDKFSKMAKEHNGQLMLMCDSLGNLSTTKEIEDVKSGSDKRDMTRPGQFRRLFRSLTGRLGKTGTPMLATNHVHVNIGAYGSPKVMGGGGGPVYIGSTIVFLSKSKVKDEKDKANVIGNIITCSLQKSRITKEFKRVETLLTYDKGLDRYFGLIPLATKHGIFKKLSRQIEMPDGSKHFESEIERDLPRFFTPDIIDKLEEAAQKEFLFGPQTYAEHMAELEEDKRAFEELIVGDE